MKKIALFLILIVSSLPLFALFNLQLRGVMDMPGIEEKTYEYFVLNDQSYFSLQREAIDNAYGLAAAFNLDIPFTPLQVGVDAELTGATYSISYHRADPIDLGPSWSKKDLHWFRTSINGVLKYELLSFVETVHLFVGGGPSLTYRLPIANEKLILDKVESATASVKTSELEDREMTVGGVAMVEALIKPPLFPLGANVVGKMYFLPEGDYDMPQKFASIQLGIVF